MKNEILYRINCVIVIMIFGLTVIGAIANYILKINDLDPYLLITTLSLFALALILRAVDKLLYLFKKTSNEN